jgi:4'-phosphopantetheinyl transferase
MTFSPEWPLSKVRESIDSEEIHVWAWPLEDAPLSLSADTELLDDDELRRMRAFYFPKDRARYAVSHANLRRILGAYLHRPAQKIRFHVTRFGKPELLDEHPALSFSLSHSHSVGLLAVARDGPIGVDVEDIRPIEAEVATGHFSAGELFDLSRLQGPAWLSGFYRCWTRKEAILKAEGVGLQRALNSFDVSLLPGAAPVLLRSRVRFSHEWKLYDVSPCRGITGALATARDHSRLACFCLAS